MLCWLFVFVFRVVKIDVHDDNDHDGVGVQVYCDVWPMNCSVRRVNIDV